MAFRLATGMIGIALVSGVAFLSAAQAATVSPIEGTTSLNSGGGFKRITRETTAGPQDRVMTGANGSARIVYDNGCVVTLSNNQSVAVGDAPDCRTAWPEDHRLLAIGAVAAAGAGIAIAIANDDDHHHRRKPHSP
jgi:hypothetical protein